MTQISETGLYANAAAAPEISSEHPAGRVTLGSAGALGLRGRLLSLADGDAGHDPDLPLTTFTIVL
ncbi:hypothetical protein CP967_22580 [Streptomyces nitrosporeus]|uniref:Uncharacterized protein n=1 Tax=Streptomyces nitrosporeus TaxID=28894 RepID=A0A5J6FE94_9ACTN|nr:hypothetical protein [Streptomyces nitrosporeus]QEU74403.1 hypothetical protein CP967_22580 [Streptomyces nitrosporeus]GGY82666.1 hypothetical protein GCM10010327_11080 [Streptomyces nitrosporeus]